MRHMSNRERIARAAEEARLEEAEKAAKKATKKPSGARSKAAKQVRMKIVWEVCNANGKAVETFPYADKAMAEALTQKLTSSSGSTHVLRPVKVPME